MNRKYVLKILVILGVYLLGFNVINWYFNPCTTNRTDTKFLIWRMVITLGWIGIYILSLYLLFKQNSKNGNKEKDV